MMEETNIQLVDMNLNKYEEEPSSDDEDNISENIVVDSSSNSFSEAKKRIQDQYN